MLDPILKWQHVCVHPIKPVYVSIYKSDRQAENLAFYALCRGIRLRSFGYRSIDGGAGHAVLNVCPQNPFTQPDLGVTALHDAPLTASCSRNAALIECLCDLAKWRHVLGLECVDDRGQVTSAACAASSLVWALAALPLADTVSTVHLRRRVSHPAPW